MNESEQRPICKGCGKEHDPDVCWCGTPLDQHTYEEHPFVPMGCDCYRVKEDAKK